MNSLTDTGAWIVAIHKVLSQYNVDDPALDELEGYCQIKQRKM
jgi:hypothetical protein